MPVVSPTVANADTASNSTSSVLRSVISASRIVEDTTAATDSRAIVSACRCARGSMRRRNAVVVGSPRTSAQSTKNNKANVVTLIPPAVPADPPPMNMNTSMPSQVLSCMAPMSTLLNPAVRRITAWNVPASTRPCTGERSQRPGLDHSDAVTNSVDKHQQQPGHHHGDLRVHAPRPGPA